MSDVEPIIDVTLRFYGKNLIPAEVTDALGVKPTKSRLASNSKTGLWSLVVDSSNNPLVGDRVEFIVDLLENCEIKFGYDSAVININIAVEDGAKSVEYILAPEMMHKLMQLKILLNFTVF